MARLLTRDEALDREKVWVELEGERPFPCEGAWAYECDHYMAVTLCEEPNRIIGDGIPWRIWDKAPDDGEMMRTPWQAG